MVREEPTLINIPVDKNRKWIAGLHESIDQIAEDLKAAIMRPVGESCASDLLKLCETHLGIQVETVQDIVEGWNILRQTRQLRGIWEIDGTTIKGTFHECGCPLVRSGMIDLHPVQCYCSQGMMETVFARVAKHPIRVEIKRSIGRGDSVCEFLITMERPVNEDSER